MAKPLKGAQKALLTLKDRGYIIIFVFFQENWAEYEMTIDWLNKHEFPFDQLILGKPQ